MTSLTQPADGSVGWTNSVNQNFATLQTECFAPIAGGRLTLQSGTPVPTIDITNATTPNSGMIYYTPFIRDRIGLYDGTVWNVITFTEKSLSLSGYSTNTNYDIWGYIDGSGNLALASTAWQTATGRFAAQDLTRQDGIYVKGDDVTRRYLGTIRIGGTSGYSEWTGAGGDQNGRRFVWNMDNRVDVPTVTVDLTNNTWTNTSTSSVKMNSGNAAWRHEFVNGLDLDGVVARITVEVNQNGQTANGRILLDDATSNRSVQAQTQNSGWEMLDTFCATMLGKGYHSLQAYHWNNSSGTTTWAAWVGSTAGMFTYQRR